MKTTVMYERRMKEKAAENDNSGYERSFFMLNQFNQLKKIARNFSFFRNYQNPSISLDILVNIIDELRRDRKIKMAINDPAALKEYVSIDLETPIDKKKKPELAAQRKKIFEDKEQFRRDLGQNLSIIKVNFMRLAVDKFSQNKATNLDPSRFKEQKEKLDAREKSLAERGIANNGHDDEMINLLNKKLTQDENDNSDSSSKSGDSSDKGEKEEEPLLALISSVFSRVKGEVHKIGE
jgi:hypothetical protein